MTLRSVRASLIDLYGAAEPRLGTPGVDTEPRKPFDPHRDNSLPRKPWKNSLEVSHAGEIHRLRRIKAGRTVLLACLHAYFPSFLKAHYV